ncbi:substrate-binding domain-containing protein, partial [Pantoea agglomerans]|uniref:substrate-binding domain-containing protein n=1 Tax=Enterobacter agglomerans TaxID=549 RepID=UPI0030CA31C0
VAIMKSAHNLPAAKAFVDFMLSEAGQQLVAKQGNRPVDARAIPSLDESFVVIHFQALEDIDLPYLLAMLQGSFISHIN